MERIVEKSKKRIKELETCIEECYNEAIDNFFKELEKFEDKDGWLHLKMSSIYEIAEELKNGGKTI